MIQRVMVKAYKEAARELYSDQHHSKTTLN